MFKRIVAAAALAGALSGLLLTGVQQIEIAPLIRSAEAQEAANAASGVESAVAAHKARERRDGWERLTATAVANTVLATAYALLLAAALSVRRQSGWRAGFAWGIAGYAVFFVAPALGIAPLLPGSDAAPLADRQMWWVGAVSCSAAGLWLTAFAKSPLPRIAGIALIVAPHVIGAPQAPAGAPNDADAAREFIRATYLANAALWLALGTSVAVLLRPGHSSRSGEGRPPFGGADSTR
ncbi:MAG: CbtA family protein [Casimicrobiaceae bacterium]